MKLKYYSSKISLDNNSHYIVQRISTFHWRYFGNIIKAKTYKKRIFQTCQQRMNALFCLVKWQEQKKDDVSKKAQSFKFLRKRKLLFSYYSKSRWLSFHHLAECTKTLSANVLSKISYIYKWMSNNLCFSKYQIKDRTLYQC